VRDGSSDVGVLTFCSKKKTLDFSKFMLCPYGQVEKAVEPVRTMGGVNFPRFCMDVFSEQPLTL